MNYLFILESKSQYLNFKSIARYMGGDIVIHNQGRKYFLVNNNIIWHFDDIADVVKNYDACISATCDNLEYRRHILEATKRKKYFFIPHSLLGDYYDMTCTGLHDERFGGLFPRDWLKFGEHNRRLARITCGNLYISNSHPMIPKLMSMMPLWETNQDSTLILLGLLGDFNSPISASLPKLENYEIRKHPSYPDFGINEVDKEHLDLCPELYASLNKRHSIVSRASSALVEAVLRSVYFGLNQRFSIFESSRRKIPFCISDCLATPDSISYVSAFHLLDFYLNFYNSMQRQDPLKEVAEIIDTYTCDIKSRNFLA